MLDALCKRSALSFPRLASPCPAPRLPSISSTLSHPLDYGTSVLFTSEDRVGLVLILVNFTQNLSCQPEHADIREALVSQSILHGPFTLVHVYMYWYTRLQKTYVSLFLFSLMGGPFIRQIHRSV